MKSNVTSKNLPLWAAGTGVLAMVLRMGLFAFGTDEKGLLNNAHLFSLLVWAVTAFSVVFACLSSSRLDGSRKYSDNFSPSTAAAIGAFALAGGIAVSVITGWNPWMRLDLIRGILGLLAIPALILIGLLRWQGKRPFFLLHALVCVYLTLFAVSHYQLWCSRPQIQDWFFSMTASLLLILFAYYQTAFDVGMGKRRMQLATGLLAAFFCLAALAGGEDLALYLSGAVWTLTNLCSLTPVPRRKKNPADAPRENGHESA